MFNSMGIYVRRRHLSLPPLTPPPRRRGVRWVFVIVRADDRASAK